MLVAVLPAAGAALTGGLLAVVAAGLGSPLSPVGVARLAEPHPGMAPNVGLLLSGLALLVALLLIPIALPAWRAVSRPPGGARAGLLDPARRSRLAEAARRRLSPAAGSGVGMALESVPGPRRAPVKAPMVTGVVAVGAVVAALCVLASLDHLLTRPRSFGWGWDITVDGQFGALDSDDVLATLSALDGVAGVAGGDYGNLTIGGRAVPAVGLDQLQGQVFPTLLEGRAATAPDEIVLGTTTMRRAHTSVGRKLSVQFEDVTRQLTVVGRAVFPPLGRGGFSPSGLGVGAAVTAAALAPQDLPEGSYNFVAVRAAPDADVGALAEMLGRARTDWGCPTAETCFVVRTPRPAELDAYAAVRWSPSLLAGLLAILAVFTLGHSLVSSVRRRRRDLAVLKTLGFVRSQVSASVAWQATTFAGIAVLFGLPLGLVAGRWAWSTFARGLGVDPTVATPLLAVALTVPLALIAANLMAAIPARTAGATRPATALRSE
jgi:hypothetical protein